MTEKRILTTTSLRHHRANAWIISHLPMILVTPSPIDVSMSEELGVINEGNHHYADRILLVASQHNRLMLDMISVICGNEIRDGRCTLEKKGNVSVYEEMTKLIKKYCPRLAPMTTGNGSYCDPGNPLEEKLWLDLC